LKIGTMNDGAFSFPLSGLVCGSVFTVGFWFDILSLPFNEFS